MQSMPLLLRQSIRSTTPLSRSAHPFRSSRPQALLQLQPHLLPAGRTRPFSVCPQCQFRTQSSAQSSSPNDNDKLTDDEKRAAAAAAAAQSHSTAAFLEESLRTQAAADAGEAIPLSPPQGAGAGAGAAESPQSVQGQGQEQVKTQQSTTTEGSGRTEESKQKTQSHGGLPSYLEDRRSQFSKQFTTMMDNLQSNVFVAGQRLNDLTGYSEIEALKKDIHTQEDRLLKARAQVRSAKEAYASAINNRSASQREVNELLQRKHAWSPVDLERFTHLYRNDHTNEVAENEAQEALTAAERESEEAAAQLSKSILSRYHEEQVWSDKIRRMSTWGTWGLMGVNVLLFLIFQIGVEPWRRKRLVKGFEDKVIEAIEKEKGLGMGVAQSVVAGETAAAAATPATEAAPAASTTVAAAPATLEEDTAADRSVVVADSATEAATPEVPDVVSKDPVYESYRTQIPTLPGTVSVDAWRQYFHDLFSDRGMIITQRDLSTVALQSAAAGAAIMGLVIAVIRPR